MEKDKNMGLINLYQRWGEFLIEAIIHRKQSKDSYTESKKQIYRKTSALFKIKNRKKIFYNYYEVSLKFFQSIKSRA